MLWKEVWNSVNEDTPLKMELIDKFAALNQWSPDILQSGPERIASDLQSYTRENKLLLIKLLSPTLEPGQMLLDSFRFLVGHLINSRELKVIEMATSVIENAFKTHVPPNSPYEQRLKSSAKDFILFYVSETQRRWKEFNVDIHSPPTSHLPLDPYTTPRLFRIIFQFGTISPLPFYDLLNSLALHQETRIHAFILLKAFLILEDAPTYYLIDAELYKTVIKSALHDTEPDIFLTAITILTILLPIVATKAVDHLDNLKSILLFSIEWELSFIPILTDFLSCTENNNNDDNYHAERGAKDGTETGDKSGDWIEMVVCRHSIQSIRQCINDFFTILYGMFPCNVINSLTNPKIKSRVQNTIVGDFQIMHFNSKGPNSSIDTLKSSSLAHIKDRINNLLGAHKFHFNFIGCTAEAEILDPWFINKESSEIMIACFELQCNAKSVAPGVIEQEFDSLRDVQSAILKINSYLYGYNPTIRPIEMNEQTQTETRADEFNASKLFYVILINESFFKECMRQYHIMHIRSLRKQQVSNHIMGESIENVKLRENVLVDEVGCLRSRLVSQQQEAEGSNKERDHILSSLQARIDLLNDRLDKSVADRQRFEDQLNILTNENDLLHQNLRESKDSCWQLNRKLSIHESKLDVSVDNFENINISNSRSFLDEKGKQSIPHITEKQIRQDEIKNQSFETQPSFRDYESVVTENNELKQLLAKRNKEIEDTANLNSEFLKSEQDKFATLHRVMLQLQAKLLIANN